MVAGAQPQPQLQHQSQPQQHQNPQKQQLPLTSAEEEALKRNTDCVYFLASPLTCKKGSECEYRHSEYARVNPRDCWYWLNGNCLNPKCTFRHPPLDGLLGAQATTPTGASLSSSQPPAAAGAAAAAAVSVTHVPFSSGSGKQAVPCIFFQKGLCLKGDRCAFLHGPNPPTGSKAPQAPASTLGSETSSLKKPFGGLQKCAQEKKILQPNVSNSVGVPLHQANTALKVETSFPRNGASIERNAPSAKAFNDETFRPKTISNVTNGIFTSRSSRAHQVNVSDDHSFQNGKDADEILRESSPGFDVLVDDELRDSDYFPGEDQYGRARGLDGRNVNSLDEYDMDQSGDYSLAADLDNDRYCDPRGYDSLDHMQGQYAWDQHRASSERVVVEPPHLDRRGYRKSNNSDHIDESDLRYRLSKHRRVNGLRSVISHEYGHDDHVDGRGYKGSSRRDSHQITPRDASASSRLRGRIKLPGRTSPVNDSDMRPDREHDRGRVPRVGRLSPSRTEISTRQGRLRDRIKARVHEDYNKEGGNFRGPHMSREIMEDNNASFAAPKRLSELKVGKFAENKEQSQLGRRKSSRMDTNEQSEGDLSFEGPKPLSEILKRKRGADAASSGSGKSSVNKEENNQQSQATQGEEEGNSQVSSNKEEFKSATADIVQTEEKTKTSQEPNANDLDAEDGMIYEETVEDQELEGEYQRDGEYDYEQGEEGEYYEGENAEGEEEYYEEEEEGEDDFAKKIGVELS
ncbi:hypothetical protein UlMin_034544 [Ulmus minor]